MNRIPLASIMVIALMTLNGCWLFNWKQKKVTTVTKPVNTNTVPSNTTTSFGKYNTADSVAMFDENIGDLENTEDFILAEHSKIIDQKSGTKTGAMTDKKADTLVVYFDYDSNIVRQDQQKMIDVLKNKVEEWNKEGKMVVFKGHSCNWHGPQKPYDRSYNVHLSNERALRVVDACRIPKNNCKIFGVGNEEPVVFENSKAGQSPNRRVEVYTI